MNSPMTDPDLVTEDIITKPKPSVSRRFTVMSYTSLIPLYEVSPAIKLML